MPNSAIQFVDFFSYFRNVHVLTPKAVPIILHTNFDRETSFLFKSINFRSVLGIDIEMICAFSIFYILTNNVIKSGGVTHYLLATHFE